MPRVPDAHDVPELGQEAHEVGVLGTCVEAANSPRTTPLPLEREADHEGIDEGRWVFAPDVNGDGAIPDVRWRGGRGVLVGILVGNLWSLAFQRWRPFVR